MTKRIMLVDDEIHILRAAEFKLAGQGYEIECASDGQEAWEKLQGSHPDILVTDVQMPRMTGLELLERIRASEHLTDLPVILLTAKGFELPRQETFARHGVLEIMSKPFSPRNLCRRIQLALEENGRSRDFILTSDIQVS